MKRIISVFLIVIILLPIIATTASASLYYDEYGVKDCSVIAGNVTLPLAEYPVGSTAPTGMYFPLPNGTELNVYGKQCIGFARYVFYRCFGVVDCTFTGLGGYYSVVEDYGYVSPEYLKSKFNSGAVLPGAHIRISTSSQSDNGHSMIYLKSDDTYIYTYECNLNWNYDVSVVRRSWSQMASFTNYKGGLAFIHMPNDYPDTLNWDCAADGHKWNVTENFAATGLHEGRYTRVCGICGEKEQTVFECSGNCEMSSSCPGSFYHFSDMPDADNWAHNSIEYVLEYALLSGLGDGRFDPNGSMTRAMLVNVLWRVAGKPNPNTELSFTDVAENSWYSDSVLWAAENGIAAGIGNGKFKPNAEISREQIAVILRNFSKFRGNDVSAQKDISTLSDNGKVSSWARDAVSWAFAEGYISGKENNGKIKLDPQGSATRAEVSSILMRYVKPQYDAQQCIGTVNNDYVNIRSGPDTSHPVVSSAGTGTQILVMYKIDGWYRIRTAKGTLGYIIEKYVDIP